MTSPRNSPTPSVRELELRWEAHEELYRQLAIAIDKAEEASQAALKAALADHHREHGVHAAAHDREHQAHGREHALAEDALVKATSAHHREHAANAEAIRVADSAMNARLASLNEFREQLRDQARTFASIERVEGMAREFDRRVSDAITTAQAWYENNRQRIEAIEKGDVKTEGKGIGQAGTVASIIAAVTITGAILGILVLVANFMTARP
jgi:hypothetical protein